MKRSVLFVVASAIIASVQSMELTRSPLNHRPVLLAQSQHPVEEGQGGPIIISDNYPMELVKEIQEQESRARKESSTGGEVEDNVENSGHPRLVRSPKEPVTGKIVVSGGARRGSSTGGKTEGNIYVGGQIRFRRSPKEPVSGRIEVTGRAVKGSSTRGKTEGNIYVGGQIRFRRSAEEQEELSENGVAVQQSRAVAEERGVPELPVLATKPLSVKIIATEAARKEASADEISEGNIHDGTESRFRRSPEPKRRHRTNVDISFDKKIVDKGRGSISINGGASKRPGERWDPHVGVSGSIRF